MKRCGAALSHSAVCVRQQANQAWVCCAAPKVRSDRNQYSKNLIESQDEIAEMKRKFKIMNHQIEQLKEEIQAKDQVDCSHPTTS